MKNKIKFRLREGTPCINATDGSGNLYIANEYNSTLGQVSAGLGIGNPVPGYNFATKTRRIW